jgi:hypothetical protein
MVFSWYNDAEREKVLKSFNTFLLFKKDTIYKNNNYICLECDGKKRVIADYEHPDPAEGYKMADRVTCSKCSGTGTATEKQWREYFKQEQKKFRDRKKEDKEINRLKKQALSKLTKEEREVLGYFNKRGD